jgi:hypothetical protein
MAIGYYFLYFTVIFPILSVFKILRVKILVKYGVLSGLAVWLVLGVSGEENLWGLWDDLCYLVGGFVVVVGVGVKAVFGVGSVVWMQVVEGVWRMAEGKFVF